MPTIDGFTIGADERNSPLISGELDIEGIITMFRGGNSSRSLWVIDKLINWFLFFKILFNGSFLFLVALTKKSPHFCLIELKMPVFSFVYIFN